MSSSLLIIYQPRFIIILHFQPDGIFELVRRYCLDGIPVFPLLACLNNKSTNNYDQSLNSYQLFQTYLNSFIAETIFQYKLIQIPFISLKNFRMLG
jgi:hypothetical protein